MRPCGGDEEVRTPDPLRARQVLSQLSYTPELFTLRALKMSVRHPQNRTTFSRFHQTFTAISRRADQSSTGPLACRFSLERR